MSLKAVTTLNELRHWFLLNQVSNKELYVIGILIVLSLLIAVFTKRFGIPTVVGYVFLGILVSVSVVKKVPLLSQVTKDWYAFLVESFDYVSNLALAFIALTIGTELSINVLKNLGKKIILIVIFESFGAFILVTASMLALGKPFYLALLLGAISSATAPAATVMVLQEYNAEGNLTSTLLAVVGIDDALALTIFSFAEPIALIKAKGSGHLSLVTAIVHPAIEILGSVGVGLIIGYLSQLYITAVEDKTKRILTLVATVLGCSSLAVYANLSPLLTNMAVGFAYTNFSTKNLGIAEDMEVITIPLYAMFFVLAGTKIKIMQITSIGFLVLALVYTVARLIGKVGGASLGATIAGADDKIKKYIGLGLLSQVGVAIALAYTIQRDFAQFPELAVLIFNILLFTTAITEVIGPLATKYAVSMADEIQK